MAKGKHAAALFEVINRGNTSPISRAKSLSTPRWWFKRSTSDGAPAPEPIVAKSIPMESPKPAPARAPSADGAPPTLEWTIDRDHHFISLRLSFITAGVACFAVLVLFTLAYLVGKRANAPAPVAVLTSEDLKKYPPYPQVMDVTRANQQQRSPLLLSTAESNTVGADAPSPAADPQTPPTPLIVTDVKRVIGLNYVVVQSYPSEKDATDARDLLLNNGIPCTVEKPPQALRLPDTWFSVVGTSGFERISTREWENYITSINALSSKFEATGKTSGASKFKKFTPLGVKWRETR